MDALTHQKKIIDSIVRAMEAAGQEVSQFETHISRVLVAGEQALKFKKAVRLPFLDFSMLEARRYYCEQECRLNRRLAPELYLGVAPITGEPEHALVDGGGPAIEYAVRMRAFGQQALWSHRIAYGLLDAGEIDALASKLARFHIACAAAAADSALGEAATIAAAADETLADLADLAGGNEPRAQVAALRSWESEQRRALAPVFADRKAHGMIRECHGDLHAGNILTEDGRVEVFDCIEFSDSLRWIDVMNDLAFIHMDLAFQQRSALAARLLNRYLEITGDYAGLAVLRYYAVQRALVRSKVMLLRAGQLDAGAPDRAECERSGLAYLAFAQRCAQPRPATIMITHGYSGSGKTTFAREAAQLLGAVQVRSDVERKRMHGLGATSRAEPALYEQTVTQATYERLLQLARRIVASGWPVIVDAAFLTAAQRKPFALLADTLGVPFFLFDVRAGEATMKQRILAREQADADASDAGIAVLVSQLRNDEPLNADEMRHAIAVDMESGIDSRRVATLCAPVLDILGHE